MYKKGEYMEEVKTKVTALAPPRSDLLMEALVCKPTASDRSQAPFNKAIKKEYKKNHEYVDSSPTLELVQYKWRWINPPPSLSRLLTISFFFLLSLRSAVLIVFLFIHWRSVHMLVAQSIALREHQTVFFFKEFLSVPYPRRYVLLLLFWISPFFALVFGGFISFSLIL